jgi:hypothetical protein
MRQGQRGDEAAERVGLLVGEALRGVGGPGRVDAVEAADEAVGLEAVDHDHVLGLPLRARLLDQGERVRVGADEVAAQDRVAGLEQVVERALPPAGLGLGVLAGAAVLDDEALVGRVAVPAEDAALVDRVQRVDEHEATREREAGGHHPLAEAPQQVGLGRAG